MTTTNSTVFISKLKILSVFDFDGTLTYYDSFILFLYFAFGKYYFIKSLIRMILPVLYCAQYKLTRNKLKEILIKVFLTDVKKDWLSQQAKNFYDKYWSKLIRSSGILAIIAEINAGAEVVICSASPELILQPFANKFGVKFIGTQLEVKNDVMTGYISGKNCTCAQKIIRLREKYGNLKKYHLRAWGDTRGDYELLAAAQEPHWRDFNKIKISYNIPQFTIYKVK